MFKPTNKRSNDPYYGRLLFMLNKADKLPDDVIVQLLSLYYEFIYLPAGFDFSQDTVKMISETYSKYFEYN